MTGEQMVSMPQLCCKQKLTSVGDDTKHSKIPYHSIPGYYEAKANFPEDGSDPKVVDVIFYDL